VGQLLELGARDPALAPGHLLGAAHLEALAVLEGADVAAGLVQGITGAGVEPGHAPTHQLHLQLAFFEIHPVEIGDFQLAAVGGPHLAGALYHGVVVEVEAGHGKAGAGFGGFFLQAEHPAIGIELHHAVALRVAHGVGEDGGPAAVAVAGGELGHQVVAVEEVVAQHQGGRRTLQEAGADQEGLGQACGAGLYGVVNGNAPGTAVAEQALEQGLVVGGGDDQHLADARQHQGAERVVDHRLVVHRQQLLAHRLGDRMQACAAAAGEDDPFAGILGSVRAQGFDPPVLCPLHQKRYRKTNI